MLNGVATHQQEQLVHSSTVVQLNLSKIVPLWQDLVVKILMSFVLTVLMYGINVINFLQIDVQNLLLRKKNILATSYSMRCNLLVQII